MLGQIDSAPVVLRLMDQIPLNWSLPLLTVVGLVAGWLMHAVWSEGVGEIRVDDDNVLIKNKKTAVTYARDTITEAFLDKDELGLLDASSRELVRTSSENSLAPKLEVAFERHGYAWSGRRDPREEQFTDWVDHSTDIAEGVHELLRSRHRALADDKGGEAATLREKLQDQGVIVRDRDGVQQVRHVQH